MFGLKNHVGRKVPAKFSAKFCPLSGACVYQTIAKIPLERSEIWDFEWKAQEDVPKTAKRKNFRQYLSA